MRHARSHQKRNNSAVMRQRIQSSAGNGSNSVQYLVADAGRVGRGLERIREGRERDG